MMEYWWIYIQGPGDSLPRDSLSGKWPRGHFENFDVDKIEKKCVRMLFIIVPCFGLHDVLDLKVILLNKNVKHLTIYLKCFVQVGLQSFQQQIPA